MVTGRIEVHDQLGIHLRPAGRIADEALKYRCSIELCCSGRCVTAKSLLSILSLGVRKGSVVEIRCHGTDEAAALENMLVLMRRLDSGDFTAMPGSHES